MTFRKYLFNCLIFRQLWDSKFEEDEITQSFITFLALMFWLLIFVTGAATYNTFIR